MRIFITGGSGFAGGHLIESLAPEHEIRALARSDRSEEVVRGLGAEPVRGHLGAVRPADLDGVDAVVHAAAFVGEWGPRERFWADNVEGTRQLLDAARGAGVGRFIHIGTEAALFDGRALIDIDERHPYPRRHRFLYSETKAEAEKSVLAANAPGFATLSLRPRFIWGPRDQTILPTVLEMVEKGAFAWIDGGRARTSTTHVANLVHAVSLALERGAGGEAYFITDAGERSLREMFTRLAATRGVTLPERSLPGFAARSLAAVCEALWGLVGAEKAPPITRFTAAMMSRSITLQSGKARAELGYEPVISVDEGLDALARQARSDAGEADRARSAA